MYSRILSVVRCALAIWFIFQTCFAGEITFYGPEISPFFGKEGDQIQGLFYEMAKDICEKEKLACRFDVLPIRRIFEMMEKGEADFMPITGYQKEREAFMVFSSPVLKTYNRFFGDKKLKKKIKKLEDLKGFNVGVFGPTTTSKNLKALNDQFGSLFNIIEEPANDILFNKLNMNRYGDNAVGFANEYFGEYWMAHNSGTQIENLSIFQEELVYYMAASKLRSERPEVKAFLNGLEKFIKKNQVKIFKKKYIKNGK